MARFTLRSGGNRTGRFTPGATDNTGLGMWSNEFSLGTTVYFDPGKKWHASAAGFYEIHSSKHDQDLKVGDLVTLEGGIRRAFLKGYANAGLAYFGQWKVGPDRGADVSPLVAGRKGYMLGLRPELNMPISPGKTPLLLTIRNLLDTRSRFSTQGDSAVVWSRVCQACRERRALAQFGDEEGGGKNA